MDKHLHFDCFSGISGDMTLAALVDLGADHKVLAEGLAPLCVGLGGDAKLLPRFERVERGYVSCLLFSLEGKYPEFKHHDLSRIEKLIQRAGYSTYVEEMALRCFYTIGQAEAKVHGVDLGQVHFHEVGAVDSIVDVVGTALLLENLAPSRITASVIQTGYGVVECQHGNFPIPALATLEILKGFELASGNQPYELVTPTGAGILKTYVEEQAPGLPLMQVEALGYGAGQRELPDQPNVLRLVLGKMKHFN